MSAFSFFRLHKPVLYEVAENTRWSGMDTKNFDRLVGFIYDAALEPALWRETLDELAGQLETNAWHLLGWDAQLGVGNAGRDLRSDCVRSPRPIQRLLRRP